MRKIQCFPKFCGFAGWESQLLRTGGCGGPAAEDAAKFAPRLRARAVRKSKSLKTGSVGALLEVEAAKICTTPARENDLEVKTLKTESLGRLLEVEVAKILHHACARTRFGSQNR